MLFLSTRSKSSQGTAEIKDILERIVQIKLPTAALAAPAGSSRGFVLFSSVCQERMDASALMVLQSTSGSDYYGPVQWRENLRTTGRAGAKPGQSPVFARRELVDGIEEAISDVVPLYHAKNEADDSTRRNHPLPRWQVFSRTAPALSRQSILTETFGFGAFVRINWR
jgi:hypothetical protein